MLKAWKLNGAQDTFRRLWSTTFKGAIERRNIIITEIALNKTIRYNVKLLASGCFFITSNIRFLNTPVYLQTLKDMIYSINCISVITTNYVLRRCTLFGLFVMEVTSRVDFQSTSISFNPTYCLRYQSF